MMSLLRRRDPGELVFWLAGVSLVLGPFLWRLQLLMVRAFDADELQHLHSAWLVSEGFLPYRDYFQHHTPGLHYLLGPLFWLADVKTDPASALRLKVLIEIINVLAPREFHISLECGFGSILANGSWPMLRLPMWKLL